MMWVSDSIGNSLVNLAHAELISIVELEQDEEALDFTPDATPSFALAVTLTSSDELYYLFIGSKEECHAQLTKLTTRVPFLKGF